MVHLTVLGLRAVGDSSPASAEAASAEDGALVGRGARDEGGVLFTLVGDSL